MKERIANKILTLGNKIDVVTSLSKILYSTYFDMEEKDKANLLLVLNNKIYEIKKKIFKNRKIITSIDQFLC